MTATSTDLVAVARVLFADTAVGRTLRALVRAGGRMKQADLMREYRRWQNRKTESKSAFLNQFGRHVRMGMIQQECVKGVRNVIVWTGPTMEALLADLPSLALYRAYESIERQMMNPRPADLVVEVTPQWCTLLHAAVALRPA